MCGRAKVSRSANSPTRRVESIIFNAFTAPIVLEKLPHCKDLSATLILPPAAMNLKINSQRSGARPVERARVGRRATASAQIAQRAREFLMTHYYSIMRTRIAFSESRKEHPQFDRNQFPDYDSARRTICGNNYIDTKPQSCKARDVLSVSRGALLCRRASPPNLCILLSAVDYAPHQIAQMRTVARGKVA